MASFSIPVCPTCWVRWAVPVWVCKDERCPGNQPFVESVNLEQATPLHCGTLTTPIDGPIIAAPREEQTID